MSDNAVEIAAGVGWRAAQDPAMVIGVEVDVCLDD
jgi:hypothetical protein